MQALSQQETSLRRNPELELSISQSPATNKLLESNNFLLRVIGRVSLASDSKLTASHCKKVTLKNMLMPA